MSKYKKNTDRIVDLLIFDLKKSDKKWNSMSIEMAVNIYKGTLTFVPTYVPFDSPDSKKALLLSEDTRRIVELYFLKLHKKESSSNKDKWNKMLFSIKYNDGACSYDFDKKMDEDLNWLNLNKNKGVRLSMKEEFAIITYDGLPEDFDRYWKVVSTC